MPSFNRQPLYKEKQWGVITITIIIIKYKIATSNNTTTPNKRKFWRDRYIPSRGQHCIPVFTTHKYSWNFEFKVSQQYWNWTTRIRVRNSIQCWFLSKGCNEYAYNIDIKLIPFEICLTHKPTHLDPDNLKKNIYKWFDWKETKNTQAKKTEEQTEQIHNHLVSILVFEHESYLFCVLCICWVMKNRYQQLHTCC